MSLSAWKPSIVLSSALLLAASLSLAAQPAAATPAVGKQAPQFTGVDSYGKSISLADFRGKTAVLEWTNHDCPYVRRHYGAGNMQALQKETTKEGVVWISIVSSAPGREGHVVAQEANDLTKRRGAAPSFVVLDPKGAIGQQYRARTTPHMYVVDPAGKLAYMGAIDDNPWGDNATGARNFVRLAVAAVKAGKPVAQAATRPYGCSVKYAY